MCCRSFCPIFLPISGEERCGKGSRGGLIAYLVILTALILFSTWLQGWITARLAVTSFAGLGRTIAAMAAGLVQVAVLFPLEKFVLFKKE